MNILSKTLFIPFYFKYKESVGEKNIYDAEAVKFFSDNKNRDIINFSELDKDKNSFTGVISRTMLIDDYLRKILEDKEKKFNVFNVGCGLDCRNKRLSLSNVTWTNIDLPEVIEYRNNILPLQPNEKNISADITKTAEWDFIPFENNIFIFEGILMFFEEEKIKELLKNLVKKSKTSWFIIESSPNFSDIKHPSVSSISSEIKFKWGCNDIKSFAEKIDMEYIGSRRMEELLKDRWDYSFFDKLGPEIRDHIVLNCRITLLKNK